MKKTIVAGIAVFFILAGFAYAAPVKLKFATMDPAQSAPVKYAYQPWVDSINKDSKGTLDIEVYPGGSLGRNPSLQLKLVMDGVADMAFIIPAYTPGRFPEDDVFLLPFLAENGLESAIASQRMYNKGLLSGYDDVVLLAHYTTDVLYLNSTFPVRAPEDLKGRKLRAGDKFQADYLKRIGAVGIGLSNSKTAENMSRGIIDGSIGDNSSLFSFRISDVANYHYQIPLGTFALAVVMNKEKYESLPPEAKDAINKRREDLVTMWYEAAQRDIKERFEELKTDPKHTVATPTPAEMEKWKAALQPAVDAWIEQDPKREKLIKAYQEELDSIRSVR